MPQPEGSQLSFGYSGILTNVGLNYLPKLEQYIGRNLFPTVSVGSPVGIYNVWNNDDFLRRNGKEIANYEAVPLGGFSTSQQTFQVKNWGVGTPYTATDLATARRGGMSDQAFKNSKARWVTTQGVLEQEFRMRDLIQTAGNWSTTVVGVASAPVLGTSFIQWDNVASTPIDDILAMKRRMRFLGSGREANTLVLPEPVYLALRKNPQIIQRVTPGFYGAGQNVPVQVSMDQLKALFDIQTILVPKGVYNSAPEGQPKVIQDIWNANIVWMGYVTDTPNVEEPSAGYNFAWNGDTSEGLPADLTGEGPQMFGAARSAEGLFIRNYMDVPRGAMVIEGMLWSSPNVVGAPMGMTWTNVLAAP